MTLNATSGPRVLLIGQRTNWGGSLITMLEASRCTVRFARDLEEITGLLEPKSFDLILAGSECRHEMHLSPELAGSRTSVFYVFPVENSCWWVPAMLGGVDCYGSSALRPAEFAVELREILHRHEGQTMKAAS
jgi:hypothetical protein